MNIYIKPKKKAVIIGKESAKLKDIAEIEAPESVKIKLESMTVVSKKDKIFEVVSVTNLIRLITKEYPEAAVVHLGENDTVVEFSEGKKQSIFFMYMKIIFVCVVLFTGASTAIMSFHSDAQMPKVFEKYTSLFLGEQGDPRIIEIAYSIGLSLGIIVFFNHFAGIKITKDPTPIEVEMTAYGGQVNDTLIETLSRED